MIDVKTLDDTLSKAAALAQAATLMTESLQNIASLRGALSPDGNHALILAAAIAEAESALSRVSSLIGTLA